MTFYKKIHTTINYKWQHTTFPLTVIKNGHMVSRNSKLSFLVHSSSVLNICIIGISRYCAVTRPLAYARCKKSRRKAVLFIVIAWSVAIATSAPLPVTWLLNDGKDAAVGSCVVYADVGVVTYTASVTYFIPVAIMMFVTCTTCWELRKRRRIINVQPPTSHPLSSLPASQSGVTRNRPDEWMPESRQQGESIFQISTTPEVDGSGSVRMRVFAISTVASGARDTESYLAQWNSQRATHRHVRSMVSLVIIAVAVVVCWSPFYCIYVMRPICRRCRFPPSLITGAIWMGYINSTINPLIYAWVNTNFRKSIRKIIGCTFRRFV